MVILSTEKYGNVIMYSCYIHSDRKTEGSFTCQKVLG